MKTKAKILVVSRDIEMVEFLQRELNGEYEVINTHHNGIPQLIELVNIEEPEIIIMDIIMPSEAGIEMCIEMRQFTQTPIIMLTTWGAGSGMVKGLDLGSTEHLSEPFGSDEIKKQIKDMPGLMSKISS